MIYIRTFAYNAEKTIERAIESILNQTHTQFKYYILENGSTDGTREIIKKYAAQDERVVPFYGDVNYDKSVNREFWHLLELLEDEDYFCTLDADDYYEVTFLEEMLAFLKENNLGFAACGSRFLDGETNTVCGERVLDGNVVVDDARGFDFMFPVIHWNLRQTWGKIYTAKAARARYDINPPEWFPKAYGGDTVNIYECIKASKSIGVYGKCLHTYTISNKSVSYKWIEGRETADFILFEKAQELIVQKCGEVSPRNLNFLYAVQFNALRDTLRVLFGAELPAERKLEILKGIFENPITKQTFLEEGNVTQEEKTKLLTETVCGMLELAQSVDETSLQHTADVCKVFNAGFSELIPAGQLGWYIKKLPVVVRNVALGEYEYGVNNLLVYLARDREAELAVDYPFVLGQMLASLRNEEAKYVYFSKQLIRWCIDNHQPERARQDLDDWLQILPEDEELKELNRMC